MPWTSEREIDALGLSPCFEPLELLSAHLSAANLELISTVRPVLSARYEQLFSRGLLEHLELSAPQNDLIAGRRRVSTVRNGGIGV